MDAKEDNDFDPIGLAGVASAAVRCPRVRADDDRPDSRCPT